MSHEREYYDVLKVIAKRFRSPAQLRRNADNAFGLDYPEVLEMAYDNIQELAAAVIKGRRRPAEKSVASK